MKPNPQALTHLPIQTQYEAVLEGMRMKARANIYYTCKTLLGYKHMTPHTHQEMCDALQAPTKRKLIVMPRGTFKSSIGVVGYSIWSLINNPNLRILIDSEVYLNSRNFLREIKAHLQSEWFVKLFGSFRSENNWNEAEITISQRTTTLKEASITCGGIDTVKVGQHYDIIIADDLNSGNNSLTREGCEKVIRHYQMSMAILEPEGTFIVIGTRYNVNDIPGYILANEVNAHGLIQT